jgi:hypothetical protein
VVVEIGSGGGVSRFHRRRSTMKVFKQCHLDDGARNKNAKKIDFLT